MRARLARLIPAGHDIEQAVGSCLTAVGVGLIWGIGAALIVFGVVLTLYGIAKERG